MSKNLKKFADYSAYEGAEVGNSSAFAIQDENGVIVGYKNEDGEVFLFQGGEGYIPPKHYYAVFADGSKMMLDGLTIIGYDTFTTEQKSNLVSAELPNSVTYIEGQAFYNCSSLTSVEIPNSVTYIGIWAFADCTSLASVIIQNGVKIISEYAFRNCYSLTSVIIPNSVTSIDKWVFNGCVSLTAIYYSGSAEGFPWDAPYATLYPNPNE